MLCVADWGPIWNALAADIVATFVVFGFSLRFRNSSLYDPYWSVIPPLLAVYWMIVEPGAAQSPLAWLVIGLVGFWGIRLTANWTLHWGGLGHEDWRYPLVRDRAGGGVMGTLADLLGIHLFPTIQVFLGCLPIYVLMQSSDAPWTVLVWLASAVTLSAILIETIADLQLHAFIRGRQRGTFIRSGLWAWSRHPNYFGELSFWWGLMLLGLTVAPDQWWRIVPGALSMTGMFALVSIPLMDQRSLQRRPGYADHMRRVSALVPMRPRFGSTPKHAQ